MNIRRAIVILLILLVIVFTAWRFVRPMNIFVVTANFERPVSTDQFPAILETLSAEECAACHKAIFDEWSTTIHSKAWTDPYFQIDFEFDGNQQICKNCHTPLDRQQENLVLGFRDKEKWDPILAPNPDFDPDLQNEGVTCAGCHLREGKILGTIGTGLAPHPVEKIANGNQICVGCHVVEGDRWDTFYRVPPCGTVAEMRHADGYVSNTEKAAYTIGPAGEIVMGDTASLGCIDCHMPLAERPIVKGGRVRSVRQHTWRGGHDPEMVKSGLAFSLQEKTLPGSVNRKFSFTLTNVGAAHFLPTGTPDRHLTVSLRVLDDEGEILKEKNHKLKRTIMWRPFIVDLWDTRLPRGESRAYDIEFSTTSLPKPNQLEVIVRYFLVDDRRRERIGYDDKDASSYEVFRQFIPLGEVAIE